LARAASHRGLMRFKIDKGALNVAIFIGFMKRLITPPSTKAQERFRKGWN
jgi:hypothetical protein